MIFHYYTWESNWWMRSIMFSHDGNSILSSSILHSGAPQHSIHDYTLKAPAWQDGADESRGNSNPIIDTDLRKKSGPRKAAAMLLGKPDMT